MWRRVLGTVCGGVQVAGGGFGRSVTLLAIAAFCPRGVHSPAALTGFAFSQSQTVKFEV